jgi:hypothetical protein
MASASPDGRPEIAVRIYNLANVSKQELATAESEAAWLLGTAGIGVIWNVCPLRPDRYAGCDDHSTGNAVLKFAIEILPNHTRRPLEEPMGAARPWDGNANLAEVNYANVAELAAWSNQLRGNILGAVMAHELGHLLLRSGDHSAGIMQARWSRNEVELIGRRILTFTPEQAQQMRRSLAQRGLPHP